MSQAPKPAEPAKGLLDDPTPGQQQEASLRLVVLNDHEFNSMIAGSRVQLEKAKRLLPRLAKEVQEVVVPDQKPVKLKRVKLGA